MLALNTTPKTDAFRMWSDINAVFRVNKMLLKRCNEYLHIMQFGYSVAYQTKEKIFTEESNWSKLSKGTFPFRDVLGLYWSLWPTLTHLPLDNMAIISQTIFSDEFSWMKSFVFWLKFHWSLFLRVQMTINKHYWRQAIIWTNAEPIHWRIRGRGGGGGGGGGGQDPKIVLNHCYQWWLMTWLWLRINNI